MGTYTSPLGDLEIIEGYVMTVACIRKYPRDALLDAAKRHPNQCKLMGDDIESGYGLITDEDRLYLLDSGATLKVASLLEQIEQRANIKLRVWREHRGEEMVTSTLELLASGN